MEKLKFPPTQPAHRDKFQNINGDGGRLQMLIATPLVLIFTVIAWVAPQTREVFVINWTAIGFTIGLIICVRRLINATVVDHSPEALRIKRAGKEYIIPYFHVSDVSESGRFSGGKALVGATHSRYITVYLKKAYPFGSSFSFHTKKEYGDFEGLSGPAKLIRNYAEAASKQ